MSQGTGRQSPDATLFPTIAALQQALDSFFGMQSECEVGIGFRRCLIYRTPNYRPILRIFIAFEPKTEQWHYQGLEPACRAVTIKDYLHGWDGRAINYPVEEISRSNKRRIVTQ